MELDEFYILLCLSWRLDCDYYLGLYIDQFRPITDLSSWQKREYVWTGNTLHCDQSNYSSRIVISHIPTEIGPTRKAPFDLPTSKTPL